ncbi:unnamed protein product [Ectocarpus sp. 6 AP-2014]
MSHTIVHIGEIIYVLTPEQNKHMVDSRLVLGVSLAVLLVIVLVNFSRSTRKESPEKNFASKEQLDIITQVIIDELEEEAEEVVPPSLRPNTGDLDLSEEDLGELTALLEGKGSGVVSGVLGLSLPSVKAMDAGLESKKRTLFSAVIATNKKIVVTKRRISDHEKGKKKMRAIHLIGIKNILRKQQAKLKQLRTEVGTMKRIIEADNKKRTDKASKEKAAKAAAAKAAAKRKRDARARAAKAAAAETTGRSSSLISAAKEAAAKKEASDKAKKEAREESERERKRVKDLNDRRAKAAKKKEDDRREESARDSEELRLKNMADSDTKKAAKAKVLSNMRNKADAARLAFEKKQLSNKSGEALEKARVAIKKKEKEVKVVKDNREREVRSLEKKAVVSRSKASGAKKTNEAYKTTKRNDARAGQNLVRSEIVKIGRIGEDVFDPKKIGSVNVENLVKLRRFLDKNQFDEEYTALVQIETVNAVMNFVMKKYGSGGKIPLDTLDLKLLRKMSSDLGYSDATKARFSRTLSAVDDAIRERGDGGGVETEKEAAAAHKQETVTEIIKMGGIGQNVFDGKGQFRLPTETLVKIMNYARSRSLEFFADEVVSVLTIKLLLEFGEREGIKFPAKFRPDRFDWDQLDHEQLSGVLVAMRFIKNGMRQYDTVKRIIGMRDGKTPEEKEKTSGKTKSEKELLELVVRITGLSPEKVHDRNSLVNLSVDTLEELKAFYSDNGFPGVSVTVGHTISMKGLLDIGEDAGIDFMKVNILKVDFESLDVIMLVRFEEWLLSLEHAPQQFSDLRLKIVSIREEKSADALAEKERLAEEKEAKRRSDLAAAEEARARQEALDLEEANRALEEEKKLIDKEIERKEHEARLKKLELEKKQMEEIQEVRVESGTTSEDLNALKEVHDAELEQVEAEAAVEMEELEDSKHSLEDIQTESRNVVVTEVAPEPPRAKKTGKVSVSFRNNDDGSSKITLKVPSDLSPGAFDKISLFVSKEGGRAIDKYQVILSKIRKDSGLRNVTIEEKQVISMAGAEFNRIRDDYIRQKTLLVSKRRDSIGEGI